VERFGEYTMNGIGNDDTNRSETLPNDKRLSNPYTELFTGLTFSWEVNLWGRLSNQRKAARDRYLASREMTHATTSWLLGAVAQEYYELLGLDQEKAVMKENIALQSLALDMARIQMDGGKINQLAVDQFETQLLNTQGRLLAIEQAIRISEAHINQLLGRFPQPITRNSIQQQSRLPRVPIGQPEQLLKSRPDIREQELLLTAAHADVDAAKAAFYPALRLSAGVGFSAFDLSKLFLTPGSAVYNAGAGLTAPILQRKQIKALYAAASARQRLALLNYEQTLLTAFNEVFIVSANDDNLARRIELKEHEVSVQQHAYTSANDLFSVGFANYLEVITAQRRLLEVELELAELRMDRLKNRAMLYRALGGGWLSS
jgi:HAE1 family hydrophobic/amphiphilic exporter-1